LLLSGSPDHTAWRGLAALCLSAALFGMVLLSASPGAHAALHPDAHAPDHLCAVTLAAAGYCDTAAPLVPRPVAPPVIADQCPLPQQPASPRADLRLPPPQGPPSPDR